MTAPAEELVREPTEWDRILEITPRLTRHESETLHRLYVAGEHGSDPSRDDYQLACILAKHERNPKEIEELMLASELARVSRDGQDPHSDKWVRNKRYLRRTIVQALSATRLWVAPYEEPPGRQPLLVYTDRSISEQADPEWLIDGLLPKGGLTLLVGRYGAGKSFLAIDWLMHLAAGRDWQGRTARPGPGLYVYAEGSMKRRVAAWRAAHGIRPDEGVGVVFVPSSVNLLDEGTVAWFLGQITDPPAAIVFDTKTRMTPGGDENDSVTNGLLLASCGRIQAATGATVILVGHTPWDAEQQRPRGHSSLADAADAIYLLENQGGALTLTCQKLRDGEAPPKTYLTLVSQDGALVVEGGSAPPSQEDRVVNALQEGESTSTKEIGRRLKVSEHTAKRWLEQAALDGKVRATVGGRGRATRWART